MELDVNIDFDEASKEWRKNKKYIGNGSFNYRCSYIHSNGKECTKSLEIYSINKYITDRHWNKPDNKKSDIFCRQHAYVMRNNKNN
jgi:hypothetical protein